MKIDIFCHITPPKFLAAFEKAVSPEVSKELPCRYLPSLNDLNVRFRIMDQFEELTQVLTVTNPPLELVTEPENAKELSRIVNDEMAELILKYPKRFAGAVACLPLNDLEAALREIDHAIQDLHFKGIQLFSHIMGKPLDLPEFFPLYEKMVSYDLPIWIHPFYQSIGTVAKDADQFSSYRVFSENDSAAWAMERAAFGLPAGSTHAMTRLVYGKVLENYPNLKIIAHHCGSTVPYLAGRIEMLTGMLKRQQKSGLALVRPPLEYYKKFYADTALHDNSAALMCGYNFFGVDHLLFGTDMPFDEELGAFSIRKTINSVEHMNITDIEKKLIYEGNARRLLGLTN